MKTRANLYNIMKMGGAYAPDYFRQYRLRVRLAEDAELPPFFSGIIVGQVFG
jgi:hypothetical protein